MTDQALREAQRSGDTARVLGMRLRARLLTPEQLHLWAYVGLDTAREVLGHCVACDSGPFRGLPHRVHLTDRKALADWAAGLPALALPYPVREACDHGGDHAHRGDCFEQGTRCKGTGTVEREIGAQHLAVTACIGVAQAVWARGCVPGPCGFSCLDEHARQEEAIVAAERWRDDPTRKNAEACVRGAGQGYAGIDWAFRTCHMASNAADAQDPCQITGALASAAKHIPEEAVRLAVLRAIVPAEWL